jgi:ABC-type lipoprotein export system ATPase subunit
MRDIDPISTLAAVSKRAGTGERTVWALRDVSLAIRLGEFLVTMGPSSSGKSTLLNNLLAGLDVPNTTKVHLTGPKQTSVRNPRTPRLVTIAFVTAIVASCTGIRREPPPPPIGASPCRLRATRR